MSQKQPLHHILVVDDDEEYNFLTEETLLDAGVDCERTYLTRVDEALDYLADSAHPFPDLIFLDINMPMMNGWEFLEEYEKRNYHKKPARIVMISTSIYQQDREKAKGYPSVIEYVDKPLFCEDFLRIADHYFEYRHKDLNGHGV